MGGVEVAFREMRRKGQQLSPERTREILRGGSCGVLALLGDGEYPYAVPISYVYDEEKLYFHSAKNGHKIDALRHSAKASFCVIDKDEVVPEEYTTYFRSAIAFGKIRILEEEGERRRAIEKLAVKYAPQDTAEHRDQAIRREWGPLCLLEMTIEHLTGKEAIELVRERQKGGKKQMGPG